MAVRGGAAVTLHTKIELEKVDYFLLWVTWPHPTIFHVLVKCIFKWFQCQKYLNPYTNPFIKPVETT